MVVELRPHPVAGNGTVPGERVTHSRGAGQTGHAAEELADRGDQDHHLRRPRVERGREDRQRRAEALVGDEAHLRGRECDREQDEPADRAGPEDRAPDALRGAERGALRLLGYVRGCVVAGLGVHRQQEAERQDVEPEAEPAGRAVEEPRVVERLGEDEVEALMLVGDDDQDPDDHRDAEDVPADGDVVEHRDQRRREDVDQRVERQEQGVEDEGLQ